MPERLIPISRKQHDAITELSGSIRALNERLSIMASTIVAGVDDEIPAANVQGVRCENGVYSLVLSTPDIAPPAKADVA